jgi:hypothetical protein
MDCFCRKLPGNSHDVLLRLLSLTFFSDRPTPIQAGLLFCVSRQVFLPFSQLSNGKWIIIENLQVWKFILLDI